MEIENFPIKLYHPDGNSFICPTKEFYDSLQNKDEWDTLPFTGPRKIIIDEECPYCYNIKIENAKYQKQIRKDADKIAILLANLEAIKKELNELKNPNKYSEEGLAKQKELFKEIRKDMIANNKKIKQSEE